MNAHLSPKLGIFIFLFLIFVMHMAVFAKLMKLASLPMMP